MAVARCPCNIPRNPSLGDYPGVGRFMTILPERLSCVLSDKSQPGGYRG